MYIIYIIIYIDIKYIHIFKIYILTNVCFEIVCIYIISENILVKTYIT